ncbi:hypothetical protein C4K18_3474 [Pseudomonas chlororaphis subsp. aurantiaca]|nr:hypothetical protein C4K18_3474 [Pseudomonas chlororaphis subsp. aurantiaca]
MACELGGTLDGVFEGNLSLAVPARNGMEKINDVFNRFRDRTAIQWYYSNIYKTWMMTRMRHFYIGGSNADRG